MRRTSILALTLLVAAPALGQGIAPGEPTVDASGGSSSTLSLDDDTLSLTTSGAAGVDASSLNMQTDASAGMGASDDQGLSITGSNGISMTVFNLDPDGNGIISEDEGEAARVFAASSVNASGECDGLIMSPSNAEQIAAVNMAAHISLALVCADPNGLSSAQRAAIAANSALMDRLASSGYGLGDVAGIVLDANGRGTLYLSAS